MEANLQTRDSLRSLMLDAPGSMGYLELNLCQGVDQEASVALVSKPVCHLPNAG